MNVIYEAHLQQASRWKLRAVTARAYPDGAFEAAVILQEATREEERAIRSLDAPDAVTSLRSAIERCGLLVEARDVIGVLVFAWPDVLERAESVSAAPRMMSRLRPAVEGLQREYSDALEALPDLHHLSRSGVASAADLRRVCANLRRYASLFPGDWRSWLALASAERARGDLDAAWDAITRSRRLRPDNALSRSLELVIAVDNIPIDEARRRLDLAWEELQRDGAAPDFALAVAIGYTALATPDVALRVEHLDRAADATRRGLAVATRGHVVARHLKAQQLIVEALREGRVPTSEILLRVGLPHLARRATARSDVLTILRDDAALAGTYALAVA